MMLYQRAILLVLFICFTFVPRISDSDSPPGPYVFRVSCGATHNVHTFRFSDLVWSKDKGFSGGIVVNATRLSVAYPRLSTLRSFPISHGSNNCYYFAEVPKGHFMVRLFIGVNRSRTFMEEPLYDISIEGTLIESLRPGWTDSLERVFIEALLFIEEGSVSVCFHHRGHGDPAVLSLEIHQLHEAAYSDGDRLEKLKMLKTIKRLAYGSQLSFYEEFDGTTWGGDRMWRPVDSLGPIIGRYIFDNAEISYSLTLPNFYPQELYQAAIVSSDSQPVFDWKIDVIPDRTYSIWLHFAEIDPSISRIGQRIFDVNINDVKFFEDIDIIHQSGKTHAALVLNVTISVNKSVLIISLHPKGGGHAIISGIEVFEVISSQQKTCPDEVVAIKKLKETLGVPTHLGWNGDPCIPPQYRWSGVECSLNEHKTKWVIEKLDLSFHNLQGFLSEEISSLINLKFLNLSRNSIKGTIPDSIGSITSLEVLDLSYNRLNGTIPVSLVQLSSLLVLNLNHNSLSGKISFLKDVLNRVTFNVSENEGLCGFRSLMACGPRFPVVAEVSIALGVTMIVNIFLIVTILRMKFKNTPWPWKILSNNRALQYRHLYSRNKTFKIGEDRILGIGGRHDKKSSAAVVLCNMFTPAEIRADENLHEELRKDILEKCSKIGPVDSVQIWESHPNGVVLVTFKERRDALQCIMDMNGRWFGGREVYANEGDGLA